jgi:hypothetical protein
VFSKYVHQLVNINPLGDVVLSIKHEGSLDADDLIVLWLSFLIFLFFDGRF